MKNTGLRAGQEVVQLYTRQTVASRSRPMRELKGFEKIALQPGEERTVRFMLNASALGYHDEDGNKIVEAGPIRVFVGGSSTAELETGFEITD